MMVQCFNSLRIRYKILLSCCLVFIFSISLGGLTISSILKDSLENRFDRELARSTETMKGLVKTSAATSIRQHLRGIAEKNLEMVSLLHDLAAEGTITQEEARKKAAQRLMVQHVGTTGYLAIVNSKGVLEAHPKPGVTGRDISGYGFAREMIARKNGYIEYDWKNPQEEAPRPKAMYMLWFEPWDWIITVSAYREEFASMISTKDFRDTVSTMKFGKSGFAFVMDSEGNPIVPPPLMNINGKWDSSGKSLHKLLGRKNGTTVQNVLIKGHTKSGKIRITHRLIPEYGWVVAAAGFPEEYKAPLSSVRNLILITILVSLMFFLPITFVISSSITSPLRDLARRMESGTPEPIPLSGDPSSRDEVERLTKNFNGFITKLNSARISLESEISERKQMEKEVINIGDRQRRKIGHDLHDDLCPHLIGTEGLCKVLKRRLDENSPKDAPLATQITQLIREATQKTRHLSRGLCPVYLVDHGLETSLQELAENTEKLFGINTAFSTSGGVTIRDNNTATHLFLIAREAVNNAVKHSGASRITLDLSRRNEKVVLTVQDNGRGTGPEADITRDSLGHTSAEKISYEHAEISADKKSTEPDRHKPASGKDPGMGLRIMEFRANIIDADLNTEFIKDRGTRISLVLSPS